jgi:hypothetical protein
MLVVLSHQGREAKPHGKNNPAAARKGKEVL